MVRKSRHQKGELGDHSVKNMLSIVYAVSYARFDGPKYLEVLEMYLDQSDQVSSSQEMNQYLLHPHN